MGTVGEEDWDDGYSVIGDKPEVGFLDYGDDKSIHEFDPVNEGEVIISNPFPSIAGMPQSIPIGETTVDSVTILNSTDEPIDLWSVKIFHSNPEGTYTVSLLEPPSGEADVETVREFLESTSLDDRVLQPGETLTIWLSCKPKEVGLHTAILHFNAGDDQIERVVFLLGEDKVAQLLASNRPYSRAPRRKRFSINNEYVAASRPAGTQKQNFRYRLPPYPIPPDVRELIENKQVPEVLMEGLKIDNYSHFFSNLLIMEEIHLEDEMRMHDMENVTMRRVGSHLLALEVPGLAEKRPSLVSGDCIFVKPIDDAFDNKPYKGYIHRVEAEEVFLQFAKEFHLLHREGNLYDVTFTYNRVNMRRLYQAVDTAEGGLGMAFLFPSQSTSKRRSIKTSPFVPWSQHLNEEQTCAVEMILGCKGAPPYVIHGPPGTGKTMTLVEAVLQLYTTRKDARILVCAASNSAADYVLQKLINKETPVVQEHEIFRLNAASRSYEDVPSDLIHFCFFDDLVFKCPPLQALWRYRIIICTYMSASLPYAEGIRRGHFSHIFLDEAGQASEPETMVPLSNLCTKQTVVVLAGDPMQLGPVIYSKDAESYGLGKSYLERLFECELYCNENKNFVTKLVRNYRCHPAILELPSKLFYQGELVACKEERDLSLSEWTDLPDEQFPILFVGIQGCDEREGSNPSWFNRFEASKVVDIINRLSKSTKVGEGDIGVITPYRQQVLKLKKALESLGMDDVKVGSVEQFQGQERQVIIISTVRSTIKHNEFDRIFNLGFLSNPRRFNVAITRARSLLVIVGNPHIICKDPFWDKLLRYCSDKNSYQGCPLPAPQNNEIIGDEHENPFSDEVESSEEAYKAEEIPKPITDEAEWSDGWS